jgi:hypothetical protein
MRWIVCACLTALVLTMAPTGAARRRTNPLVVFPEKPERLRAFRYARMPTDRCLAELRFRGVEFSQGQPVRGIEAPVVLGDQVRGVRFQRVYAADEAPEPTMDCRLALALDDLAIVAADHGMAEVRYSSIHRPRGRHGGRGHGAGVAIDINEFVRKDGVRLNVLKDFEAARIGSRTCGDKAPRPKSAKAIELRELVCAIDDASSFNLVLTPHYDYRHRNHLHLEVRRGIDWFLTQ